MDTIKNGKNNLRKGEVILLGFGWITKVSEQKWLYKNEYIGGVLRIIKTKIIRHISKKSNYNLLNSFFMNYFYEEAPHWGAFKIKKKFIYKFKNALNILYANKRCWNHEIRFKPWCSTAWWAGPKYQLREQNPFLLNGHLKFFFQR